MLEKSNKKNRKYTKIIAKIKWKKKYIQPSIISLYHNEEITKEDFIENYKEKTGRNPETGICLFSHVEMEDCIRICDKEDHLYSIDMFCDWYHNKPKKCAYCQAEFDL